MATIFEGMYLLDNGVVREDWNQAKAMVTDNVAKHGGKVLTARRWEERKLAYPIKRRLRATYLLAYFEIPTEGIPTMQRDFNLSENVLRYLHTKVDAIPEGEAELSQAETAADFTVPPPPPDDAPDEEPEPEGGAPAEAEAPGLDAAPAEQAPEAEQAAPVEQAPETESAPAAEAADSEAETKED